MFGTFGIYFMQYFNLKCDQNESKTFKKGLMYLFEPANLTTTNIENASFEQEKYSTISSIIRNGPK